MTTTTFLGIGELTKSIVTGGLNNATIVIIQGYTSIGAEAFYNLRNLTSVIIPNSVTSIGRLAFAYDMSLTSIIIPNSVTTIGDGAFTTCSGLTSITISNSVTIIGNCMFDGCSSLTSITIPNSVTTIGDGAFQMCEGLTSITIPSSVTSINGDWVFYFCTALTNIIVDNNNANYSSDGIALFDKLQTKIIYYSTGNNNASYTIPNSVTSIGNVAFGEAAGLTSVTIPNSVTSIGESAFEGTGLTSVTIPNSVTFINKRMFAFCNNLKSIIIPSSVTSINRLAFFKCNSLTSITIPSSVTSIASDTFFSASNLKSVYFLGNIPTIGSGNFTITNDTAYYITEATNISRLTMFTTMTSLSNFNPLTPVITSETLTSGKNNTAKIYFTQLTNLDIPTPPLTNYAYSTDGTNYTDLNPAQLNSPLQISELTNGQTYSFTIKAYNGVYSNASNSVSVIVSPPPSAPIITSVSYSIPNSIKVNFTQINNSGAPVTGYKYSLDGGQTYTAMNGVTKSPLTISGIKSGLTNSIVLKSNNGQYSVASNAVKFTYYVSMSKNKVLA